MKMYGFWNPHERFRNGLSEHVGTRWIRIRLLRYKQSWLWSTYGNPFLFVVMGYRYIKSQDLSPGVKTKELAAGCDAELLSSPSGSSMDEGQEGKQTTAGWQSLRSVPSWMLVGVEHASLAALLLSLHFPTTNDGCCFFKRKIHVTPPKTDKKTPKMMVWKMRLLLKIAIFGIYVKSQWCSSLEILRVFSDSETFSKFKLKRFPRRNESKVGFLFGPCHCEPVRESRQCKMYQLSQLSGGISAPRKLVQSASRWYKFQIPHTKLASPGNMWVFLTMKGSKASWKKDELLF